MQGLPAAAALDLWERAAPLAPAERALALAAAAGPEGSEEAVARLPVGRRDARLLRLRAAFAGSALEATATCPECGEEVEFAADAAALEALAEGAPEPEPVEVGGRLVSWRLANSLDLAAAAAAGDVAEAERVLVERCVTPATGGELPPDVREAVARAMADADPLAELLLDLRCPACGAGFVADLDVAAFVWHELAARAQRLVHDVDSLARAYGWTEAEVLALGEERRATYLRLARGGET